MYQLQKMWLKEESTSLDNFKNSPIDLEVIAGSNESVGNCEVELLAACIDELRVNIVAGQNRLDY